MNKFNRNYKDYFNSIEMDNTTKSKILNKILKKSKITYKQKFTLICTSIIIIIITILSSKYIYAEILNYKIKNSIIQIKEIDEFIEISKIPSTNKNVNIHANLNHLKTINEYENALKIDLLETKLSNYNFKLSYKIKDNDKLTQLCFINKIDPQKNKLCNDKYCKEKGKIIINYDFFTTEVTDKRKQTNKKRKYYYKNHTIKYIYNNHLNTTMLYLGTHTPNNTTNSTLSSEILFIYKDVLYSIEGTWVSEDALLKVANSLY